MATVIDGCVGCGLCGENAHAATLCPSFYRAEVIRNPRLHERLLTDCAAAVRARCRCRQSPRESRLPRSIALSAARAAACWPMAGRRGHRAVSAQSTSIPGVAQRTGSTTYYFEVFPVPAQRLGGRKPVFSLHPVPGALDVLVSSELLETVRQIGNGMADAERTLVVTSTSRTLTTAEKMQLGDGRVAPTGCSRWCASTVRERSRVSTWPRWRARRARW